MKRSLWVAVVIAAAVVSARAAKTLDIYFIDVEGGQSTLIVTPAGESLLVDTGYGGNNGRDPGRILAAARDAGITRIDYLLLTHFHPDHIGGLTELAQQIPIQTFVDHGDMAEPTTADPSGEKRAFDAYLAVKKPRHIEPKPGDRLPLKGVEVVVVSSAGATIAQAALRRRPGDIQAARRRRGRRRTPPRTRDRPGCTCATDAFASSTSAT